jgi:hypothetical protein
MVAFRFDLNTFRKEFWRDAAAERQQVLFPFLWGVVVRRGQIFGKFGGVPGPEDFYDEIAVLDGNGEAEVQLPDWFEALNRDLGYQFTGIGGFAPVYVSQEVENNRFHIAGGSAGLRVSWQITGICQDAFAETHKSPLEEQKPPSERGHYLHPELFGIGPP